MRRLESCAVPAAVPPLITSPGRKVKSRETYSTYSQYEYTMVLVLYFWRVSPLMTVCTSMFSGSSSSTTMHGPMDKLPSQFLPNEKLAVIGRSLPSRMLQSTSSVTPQR